MNAKLLKHLVATLSLTLAAGAAFAAFKHGSIAAPRALAAAECAEEAIPRVVISARRDRLETAEAPIARVVVTARRGQGGDPLAAATR